MLQTETQKIATNHFLNDVVLGLSSTPKHICSKYFYDAKGDALFQRIMKLPEYYPTSAEQEIFESQSDSIINTMQLEEEVHLYEFGAGDGVKTLTLLKTLEKNGHRIHFHPIDISENALELIRENVESSNIDLTFAPLHATYFSAIEEIASEGKQNIFLFIGSNIGNLTPDQAAQFLGKVSGIMNPNDYFLLGVDKVKYPHTIVKAYNDSQGVTRDFNLNLLTRINRELGANFDLSGFMHFPTYDPDTGTANSYLISTQEQHVHIGQANQTFYFEKWESIHTEISQKYDTRLLENVSEKGGMKINCTFTDSKELFFECLMQKK